MSFTINELFRVTFHLLFLLGMVFFLGRVLSVAFREGVRRGSTLRQPSLDRIEEMEASAAYRRPLRLLRFLFLCGFVLTLAGLAGWQLAGHLDGEFAAIQRKYDQRPVSRERLLQRGQIRGRLGSILAQTPEILSGDGERSYAHDRAFAHVLGYKLPKYGGTGLEEAFADQLAGRTAATFPEAMAFAQNVLRRRSQRGADLETTLSATMQLVAYQQLAGRRGAVVAVEVDTGDVMVLCSAPAVAVDEVPWALKAKPEDAPLLNRATQGRYPPGSLLKLLTAAAALEAGLNPRYAGAAAGYFPPGSNLPVRDHEALEEGDAWQGRGEITMSEAMQHSANTYFARLGVELGWEALLNTAHRWGFHEQFAFFTDAKKNRALPLAASSFPDDMGVTAADVARVAIGQHKILVSPLHVALMYAATGNGGLLMQPRLTPGTPVRAIDRIMSERTASQLMAALGKTVTDGTARNAIIENLAVAGKTGTAENPHGQGHAWFAALAPAEAPKLCVVVLVENGGYGGQVAAPIAREVIKAAQASGLLPGFAITPVAP